MRVRRGERGAQGGQRIVGQLCAERVGERAQDRPVVARVARREHGALGKLRPPFGVDVDPGLFGIGGAGQDNVGAMGAAIAMRAEIDDEGAGRHLDLVGAEIEQQVDLAARHLGRAKPALPRREADIEPADARSGGMQNVEAVPAILDDAERQRRFGGKRQHGEAVGPRERAGAEDEHRLGLVRRRMIDEGGERVRPGAEIIVFVGQVGLLADDADQAIALEPALADAGVEHRRLDARVRADNHDRVGFVDAGDSRIEQVAGAAELGIELRAVLAAIEIGDAERVHQPLEREHLFDAGEIAGDCADLRRRRRLGLGGDRGEGLRPTRRLSLPPTRT